jgi:hypothetical protein
MKLKYIITLILILFLSNVLIAQKLKKIKEKLPNGFVSEYYVLKKDKKIKHGKYIEMGYFPKDIIKEGYYSFGEKDSLWTERFYGSSLLKNRGYYNNGNKTGVWLYYDYSKAIINKTYILQKFDHDTNDLILSYECKNNKEYEAYLNDSLVITKLDCPPSCIGGIIVLSNDIANKFSYTYYSKSKPNKVEFVDGSITFLVKKDGSIGDHKFKYSFINKDLKKILEDETINSNRIWLPAELNGIKIDAYLTIGVSITMNNNSNTIKKPKPKPFADFKYLNKKPI